MAIDAARCGPTSEPVLALGDRVLVLTPDRNSPPKHDFTAAFRPESERIRDALGADRVHLERVRVPVVDPKTLTIGGAAKQRGFEAAAQACISALAREPWTHVVFMCHGWSSGLQLGFRSRGQRGNDAKNLEDLVAMLRGAPPKVVTLFACSAGDEPGSGKTSPGTGDHSIGDYLRDRVGCPVIAHWTVGHATRNPDLIVFEASPVSMLGGVAWPPRGSKAYRNAAQLLNNRAPKGKVATGNVPPKGHTRVAFASIPICRSAYEIQALLSSEPGA